MPDIASLGLQIDSSQVATGAKALDGLANSAAAAEPKIDKVTKSADDLSKASAQVWRYGTDAAKGMDALGEATARTTQRAASNNGQMNDTVKLMRAQADEAKAQAAANVAMGAASTQASIGAQIFIDKLKDQVAVLGMSRSQLVAYQAAQLGVAKEAEASIAKIKAYEDAIKSAADAKAAAAKQTNVLTDAVKLLAAGYGALKVTEYIKDAALMAARYETLGVVTEVVGRNAGYTKTQMDAATDAIARQGITMIESRESATKLVQAHVDLKNATVLARIAQDAAVIGHLNSSEAFDRLVNGISRGNVLILRNIGINVNLQSAYRDMAGELGKATAELTENERVQARLNAVIERGADIAGTYEAAMDTAGKQITSMQRYTQDLKTVIGETFNETLTIAVMALTDGLKDANKEVSELSKNQQLHEWGRSLADVFIWVANKVGNATTVLQQAWSWADHKSARDDINAKYDGQVEDALSSGSVFDVAGRNGAQRRINSERAAALAEEEVAYVTHQAKLSAQYDAFQKSALERDATITAKHKAEADARLKVDQDYATKATALMLANAGKSVEAQQAAQAALAKSVYVGTPTYRDTEGREPKAKVDKVESTELADRLARIQDVVNAEKEMYDSMSKLDDAFHAAGKMGDDEFYRNKRDYAIAAGKDQIDAYTKQIADLKAYHNSTEAEAAKHAKQINDIEAKRAAADAKSQSEVNLLDAKEFLRKDAIASASEDATNKYLAGLDQEAKKLEESNAAHETSRGAVERKTVDLYDQAIAYQKVFMAQQAANGATAEEIAQAPVILKTLEDQRAAHARIAAGLDQQQSLQYKDKAADQAIKDWQRAGQSISESLTTAFGEGGKALGGMFQAYAKGMEGQLRAQKELATAKKLAADDPDKIAAINRAQLAGAQSQIQGYAGMTAAAQGFFSEGSRGYQAMHAATVALQGAEVALSLIKGVNAVLTQGEGDPYSAFVRMAAMAAIVTGLGVAISGGGGGGGGQSAADVQKAQGTGSVFGDSSAKSDSVRRSIEQLTANSSDMLPINQGMLTALQNIESSMTGLTNLVVRTTGLTDGANMGIQTGTIATGGAVALAGSAQVGSMIGGALAGPLGVWIGGAIGGAVSKLWGKTTQNIVDSGLQYGGSVRSLQAGQGFDQYASIDTTKSSFFGLSKSTSNRVEVQGLNDELSKQFGLIFTNLDKSLQAAATAMGGSAADVTKVLDSLTLESTKVSLKGLTGTALTDALNSVISKSMDEIAEAAFPQLDQFRTVGEGYAETVMRLAGDYAKLDSILAASSTTFGATGIASIAAREHLIELAGGIDQLASQTNSFTQNFLSKAEQLAPVQKYVTDQLAAMGLQSLDTRDKFKDYLLGLANSGALATDAGAQQYTALLALADAFAKTHAATVDLTKSEQEIADERTDLRNQLDELTMTQVQLAEKARAAISGDNLALYDQVIAAQAAKDAIAEHATILDLQAQTASATGDKAAAAAILEQQHAAALKDLTPAVADATKAMWAAQAVEKARQDALTESNSLLSIQAQIYEITGNKAGAAAVLQQQHAAALALLSPAMQAATKDLWAAQAAADKQQAATAAYSSFADSMQKTIDKITAATQALKDFSAEINTGDLSSLSTGDQYVATKAALSGADQDNAQSLVTAFLKSAQAHDASKQDYSRDVAYAQSILADIIAGAGQRTTGVVQGYSNIFSSLQAAGIGAHANGGVASGLSLVGEEGPELVDFAEPARVYTASQTRQAMTSGSSDELRSEIRLLREQVTSLMTQVVAHTKRGADNGKVSADVLDGAQNGRPLAIRERANT
jgi:hypothetical protein